LTFLRQEDQTPVAIADIAENISVKLLEYILLCFIHFLAKKESGGYNLIKDPKEINMAKVYRILEPIALLSCGQLYENVMIVKMRFLCAVNDGSAV
jgi:DNA-binding IscR family transcriptional regulator